MRRPAKLVALASLLISAAVCGLLIAPALLPGSTATSSAGPSPSPTASPTPLESPTASPTPVESPTASPTPEGPQTVTIPGEPEPIARVETIVTKGDQLPTADITEAKIIRVSGRAAEPAVTTVNLFSGDEIETGANTYVTVIFLEGALERENEIIIYPDSKITVGSGWTWWGRAFYRVRGWLSAGSDNVAGGSGGTEFTVTVCKENIKPIWCQAKDGSPPSNGTDVTVLDDNVDALIYDVAIDTTSDNASQVSRTITIRSRKPQCRKTHLYELEAPDNMPWLEFLPRSVLLRPGREATFIPRIVRRPDRPDPEPGEYKGKVEIKCSDCADREPNCEFDTTIGGATLPIAVKVRQVKVEKRQQIDVREKQLDEPKPQVIPEEEAKVLVDKTSDVILSTQPRIAAPNVMQNYSDEERKVIFKQARAAALVRNEPEGYRDMGKVNVDWGKGAKALEALEKVPESSIDKKTADFPSNLAEAYRLTDDLEKAQEQIEVAKSRLTGDVPATVRVMTVQGNIYFDRARGALKMYEQSKDKRLLTTADTYLIQAQQFYIRAVKPVGISMQPQLESVPLRNLGDAYRLQGETLISRKATAQEINVANENALSAYTKALTLNPGDRNARKGQGYGLLQKAASTQSDFDKTSLIRRAREDFARAIAEDSKDSQALVGRSLANAELGEKNQARRDLQDAIQQYQGASLVLVPDVTGKPKAVAALELVGVKLEPVFTGKGTVVIDQSPKRARVKRGTKVTLRLG
ncbi:MAG TPA: PASTA domain-containing protein [Pyrinomonadaceae bacterium]